LAGWLGPPPGSATEDCYENQTNNGEADSPAQSDTGNNDEKDEGDATKD
jgi:hypothetical protein